MPIQPGHAIVELSDLWELEGRNNPPTDLIKYSATINRCTFGFSAGLSRRVSDSRALAARAKSRHASH